MSLPNVYRTDSRELPQTQGRSYGRLSDQGESIHAIRADDQYYGSRVVAENFKFGADRNIIVALENDVVMANRKDLVKVRERSLSASLCLMMNSRVGHRCRPRSRKSGIRTRTSFIVHIEVLRQSCICQSSSDLWLLKSGPAELSRLGVCQSVRPLAGRC